MEDAEKEQCDITEEGGEEVKRFISFVKVFHVLLTALTDGTHYTIPHKPSPHLSLLLPSPLQTNKKASEQPYWQY